MMQGFNFPYNTFPAAFAFGGGEGGGGPYLDDNPGVGVYNLK